MQGGYLPKRSPSLENPSTIEDMTTSVAPPTDTSLQKILARYAVPRPGRAISNLFTSVATYVALITASCLALSLSPYLAGALSVVAAGLLLRTFLVFHH